MYKSFWFMLEKINEERLVEATADVIKKSDLFKIFEKDKDFEKRIREITVSVLIEYFRIMFQHSGVIKNLIKK